MNINSDYLKRCFVALVPDDKIKAQLHTVQQRLKKPCQSVRIRWTPNDRLHLTLCYLGRVTPSLLTALTKSLQHIANHQAPFDIILQQPQWFPNHRRPHVLALAALAPQLTILALNIQNILKQLTIKNDGRVFRGHLSLGRVKDHINADSKEICNIEKITMPVQRMVLLASETLAEGPIYRQLAQFEFSHAPTFP